MAQEVSDVQPKIVNRISMFTQMIHYEDSIFEIRTYPHHEQSFKNHIIPLQGSLNNYEAFFLCFASFEIYFIFYLFFMWKIIIL